MKASRFTLTKLIPVLVGSWLMLTSAFSDTVQLKSGTRIEGTFLGGDAESIQFQSELGVTTIQRPDIASLQIGEAAASSPVAEAAPVQPAQPAPVAPAVVPAGTPLMVRLQSSVSSDNKRGTKFSGILENDLKAGDTVVVKAGSSVYGEVVQSQQAGRLAGKPYLEIALTEIRIDGVMVPIRTDSLSDTGEGSFRKVARGAAAGAIIGEAADKKAGEGAVIGATLGAGKKADKVNVGAGSILEFQLTQPLQR